MACDVAIDTARLLDYLARLDRWAQFSWSICGEVLP